MWLFTFLSYQLTRNAVTLKEVILKVLTLGSKFVGSKNFNNLPQEIRSIPNLDTFTSHVKRILINKT